MDNTRMGNPSLPDRGENPMKTRTFLRSLALFLALFSIFLTAAVPAPVSVASGKSNAAYGDLARLTIDNRTDKTIWVKLTGDGFYYLTVPANTTDVFTPKRGDYSYTIFACGNYINGELDLNTNQRLVQPVCGGGPVTSALGANSHVVDLGQIAKIVKVTFINDTTGTIMFVMTGPSTHVFALSKDEEKDYTIERGLYDVTLYAYGCGTVTQTTFLAKAGYEKTFKCPP
jgi:hypothetical protein